LTIIYYLNGVGNTWFPFAETLREHDSKHQVPSRIETELKSRNDAVRLVEELSLEPGRHGIMVAGSNSQIGSGLEEDEILRNDHIIKIKAGDALAFFNYKTKPMDTTTSRTEKYDLVRDVKSFHAGLPTTPKEGEKWIANHWIHCEKFSQGWDKHSI
jgi:hypothetical protein